MTDYMMHDLPAQVTTDDLALWFENEPAPIYDNTLPARAVDLPDEEFWSDAAERSRYKLTKSGSPLPLDLAAVNEADYHHALVTGFAMESGDDSFIFDITAY